VIADFAALGLGRADGVEGTGYAVVAARGTGLPFGTGIHHGHDVRGIAAHHAAFPGIRVGLSGTAVGIWNGGVASSIGRQDSAAVEVRHKTARGG
jgi:hypothetical protein